MAGAPRAPPGAPLVADALRPVDPVGAAAAQRETNWRSGYLGHFRRLVEAGLARPQDAVALAEAGLVAVHDRMLWRDPDGARPTSTPRSAVSSAARPTPSGPRPTAGRARPRPP